MVMSLRKKRTRAHLPYHVSGLDTITASIETSIETYIPVWAWHVRSLTPDFI